MKTILVPIDFSKPSEYAAKLAAKMALKTNATIYLIHLIELPKGVVDMGSSSRFSIPESMLYLRKVREKVLEFKEKIFSEDIDVKYFIKLNNPFEGILKYANKIDADLIIMGSKGHSNFKGIRIGSNTEKVVRSSKTPVIVVKKEPKKLKMKNLVFASSFKNENKKEIFKKFLDFTKLFNSKIHLLKVNTASNFESTYDAKEKINEFIKEFELPKHTINIYNDLSIEKGILNFSKDINADLIALSTNGRSGLSHLFNASVTRKLNKKALKPILTLRI